MSLYTASLNSGSNGNCYYIGNNSEAVLIDVGISCREVEKRMKRLNLPVHKVKAVFISHEHSDHIKGLNVFSKKFRIPVYITVRTLKNSGLEINPGLLNSFKAYEEIRVGDLKITGFPKHHDASEPHSFIISGNEVKIGVLTDIGAPCEHVIQNFKQCEAVYLEANYDPGMLNRGNYPYHLKNRIRSGKGHLSNVQALEIFTGHKAPQLTHLFLSHLSKDNNCPELVKDLFSKHAGNTRIIIASRYEETSVYHITGLRSKNTDRSQIVHKSPAQLTLF